MRKTRAARGLSSGFRFAWVIILLLVCAGIYVVWQSFFTKSPFRTNFLLIAPEKITAVSLSADLREVVGISLPRDTVIEAVHGYGMYSLDSLLKLDDLEKAGGRIVMGSIGQTLGLPITKVYTLDEPSADLYSALRGMGGLLVRNINPAKVQEIDLSFARYEQIQPDESKLLVLDKNKANFAIGNNFYDTNLRTENRAVAIVNTTQTPFVGQAAALLLTQLGVSVLSVGNSDEKLAGCQIVANPQNKEDLTVRFLTQTYDCMFVEEINQEKDQITLKLGTENASIFLPLKRN